MLIQTIAIYYYQNKLVKINWNKSKVLVFPFLVVGITIILEIVKLIFDINPYITTAIVIIVIFAFLSFLYKREIRRIVFGKK
jgi:hypothetical protein